MSHIEIYIYIYIYTYDSYMYISTCTGGLYQPSFEDPQVPSISARSILKVPHWACLRHWEGKNCLAARSSYGNLTQIWKITIFNGKIHCKWPWSIAMLNYQRVSYGSYRCFVWKHVIVTIGYLVFILYYNYFSSYLL